MSKFLISILVILLCLFLNIRGESTSSLNQDLDSSLNWDCNLKFQCAGANHDCNDYSCCNFQKCNDCYSASQIAGCVNRGKKSNVVEENLKEKE